MTLPTTRPTPNRQCRPLVLALAALLALPVIALAQPPNAPGGGPGFGPRADVAGAGGPRAHGPAHRGHRLFRDFGFVADFLDLTEAQREQARNLHQELRERHRALRQERRTLRQEMRTELGAEAPDTSRIGELTVALHEQRQKGRALTEQAMADFEALLTEDQLESFRHLRQTLQERRQERREGRHQR